jgi:suppressor for copper-sensitivity B
VTKPFGRYGLPFNAVFGPGAPAGIVLPELLTTNAVLAAFAKSSTHIQPGIPSELQPK